MPHFPHGQRSLQMLGGNLSCGATERRVARKHLPERHAQRVQIRPDVDQGSCELLRTSKLRRSDKTSWCRNCGLSVRLIERLGQAQVDDFCRNTAVILQTDHDVTRFDV